MLIQRIRKYISKIYLTLLKCAPHTNDTCGLRIRTLHPLRKKSQTTGANALPVGLCVSLTPTNKVTKIERGL